MMRRLAQVALLSGASLFALARAGERPGGAKSSDDLVTCCELKRLRHAGAL